MVKEKVQNILSFDATCICEGCGGDYAATQNLLPQAEALQKYSKLL